MPEACLHLLPFRVEPTTVAGRRWVTLHYEGLAVAPDGSTRRLQYRYELGDPGARITMPALGLAILDTINAYRELEQSVGPALKENATLKERVAQLEGQLREMKNRVQGHENQQAGRKKEKVG